VDDSNTCNFYTVRLEDEKVSETDKFYDKFDYDGNEYLDDFGKIHELIDQIAVRGSNIIQRPRNESKVFALPPKLLLKDCLIDIFENKLRLYYVAITPQIIILLGGGVAHNEPNGDVPLQFWEAQSFAKKILDAKNDSYVISDTRIVSIDDDEPITIF